MTNAWKMAALLAAMLLLVPAIAAAEDQTDAKPICQIVLDQSLDMTTLASGGIAIPVMLNDRTFPLEVDTGTDRSAVTYEVAEELGLTLRSTDSAGMFLNNIPVTEYARLDSVGLGRLHSRGRWDMLVIPDSMTAPTNPGLLGADVLRNYDVEFDFYRGKMNLLEHNKCPAPVYWSKGAFAKVPVQLDVSGHITVEATLDGKPVTLLFDTGASLSVMSLDSARALFAWDVHDPRLKSLGTVPINGGAPAQMYAFPFGNLNFEGVAVANPNIQLIPQENFTAASGDRAQIVLGTTVLRQLHVYVAYAEPNLYLTDAEAH